MNTLMSPQITSHLGLAIQQEALRNHTNPQRTPDPASWQLVTKSSMKRQLFSCPRRPSSETSRCVCLLTWPQRWFLIHLSWEEPVHISFRYQRASGRTGAFRAIATGMEKTPNGRWWSCVSQLILLKSPMGESGCCVALAHKQRCPSLDQPLCEDIRLDEATPSWA